MRLRNDVQPRYVPEWAAMKKPFGCKGKVRVPSRIVANLANDPRQHIAINARRLKQADVGGETRLHKTDAWRFRHDDEMAIHKFLLVS